MEDMVVEGQEAKDVLEIHVKGWIQEARAGTSDWDALMAWAHRPEIEALVQKYADAGVAAWAVEHLGAVVVGG